MERSLFKPFLTVVILMSLSVISLAFTVGVSLDKVSGVNMSLPVDVGDWTGNELRFCHNPLMCAKDYKDASFKISDLEFPDICPNCGERLFNMARSEKEALPPDTEFVKSEYTNSVGRRVFTSIVLSGTERDSHHRPQRCLKAQGNTIDGEYNLEVPLEGRKPLKVRVIKTSRSFDTPDGPVGYYGYYAYWFAGKGHETASHYTRMFWIAWDRVVHSTASRWAYIAAQGTREDPEDTSYEADIIDFVQRVYPEVLTDEVKERIAN